MQVRWQWDSGMLTGTQMDAPVQKEIKKAALSAMGFGNTHQDMDECICPERNIKMQVHRRWDSGILTGTWMDAPGWKEIKKCRSIGDSIQECSPGHGWMHLPGKK